MPTPLTVDETVEVLKRSTLPTILVEGDDDVRIYRHLDSRLTTTDADVLQCGGRTSLLAIFERRVEFANLKTAFLADRDMWLFTAIPAHYTGVIFTEGYSIENDLYAASDIEDLLNADERDEHKRVITAISRWFAFEVARYRASGVAHIDVHPNQIVPIGTDAIAKSFSDSCGFVEPTPNELTEINDDYKLRIRGKTLFAVLNRFLNRSTRVGGQMNYDAQVDLALRFCVKGGGLGRVVGALDSALGA